MRLWQLSNYPHVSLLLSLLLSPELAKASASAPLRLAQQPNITSSQVNRKTAQQTFQESKKLLQQGTAKSFKLAIKKCEEVLRLLHMSDDFQGKALALNCIGTANYFLGNKQQALAFYNKALPLAQAAKDRANEATIFNQIGVFYNDQDELNQALDFFNKALQLNQSLPNREGEARILINIGDVYFQQEEWQQALDVFKQAGESAKATNDLSRSDLKSSGI